MVPITNKGSPSPVWTGTIYGLLELDDSKWKLVNRRNEYFTPRGSYNFVCIGGRIQVSKRGEHVHISGGADVQYAGQIRFGYGKVNRGRIKMWTNASGHYLPDAELAPQAMLPMDLFEPFEE